MIDSIDRLMSVMNSAFDPLYREAWNRRQVEDALALGNCRYCLFSKHGKIIPIDQEWPEEETGGFYLARQICSETELLLLAVNPEFRLRGIGQALLQDLKNTAKANNSEQIFLEMRKGNPAEFLYRNAGFIPVGQRPNYYRTLDGQRLDAITFAVSL